MLGGQEIGGFSRGARRIGRALASLLFLVALLFNTMAMSDPAQMPVGKMPVHAVVASLTELHVQHDASDINHCQQMAQCTAVLAGRADIERPFTLFDAHRIGAAEFNRDRVDGPPFPPPII